MKFENKIMRTERNKMAKLYVLSQRVKVKESICRRSKNSDARQTDQTTCIPKNPICLK